MKRGIRLIGGLAALTIFSFFLVTLSNPTMFQVSDAGVIDVTLRDGTRLMLFNQPPTCIGALEQPFGESYITIYGNRVCWEWVYYE